jgi:hypothetical protein
MKSFFVVFAVLVACVYASDKYSGEGWQGQSASAKQDAIWEAVQATARSTGSWPSTLSLLQLFIESMDTTFDTVADDLPMQGLGGLWHRTKLIHSVGAIAKVRWESNDNSTALGYTGIFKGAENGFVRMSAAKKPEPATARSFVPGVGIKFLRSGVKSANFVAMDSLRGQPSWNFFAHDLTNHAPNLPNSAGFAEKKLKSTFATASHYPVFVGLSDFASYDENGMEESPRFPFRLIFHPRSDLRSRFGDRAPRDGDEYVSQLSSLEEGTSYDIYAEDQPTVNPVLIGRLVFTSAPTPSSFSDETLFFQHQRFEADLSFRPEWQDSTNQILNSQTGSEYVYPDLPDDY